MSFYVIIYSAILGIYVNYSNGNVLIMKFVASTQK